MLDFVTISKSAKELCQYLTLPFTQDKENEFKVFTDDICGISLFVKCQSVNDFSFYFSERTRDIFHRGDRSDVHVITSLMFASFFAKFNEGITCALYDIGHPVCEDEIWGRYIMPVQAPCLSNITNWESINKLVTDIIYIVFKWRKEFWSFIGCYCDECISSRRKKSIRHYDTAKEFDEVFDRLYNKPEHFNSGSRRSLDWDYIYNIDEEVTIIKSHKLCSFLNHLESINIRKIEKVKGIKGTIIINGALSNFIKYKDQNEAKKLLSNLTEKKIGDLQLIPLENMLIGFSYPYVIALGRLCGLEDFKSERERIRNRHNIESKILFPVNLFEWSDTVCPDQFEKLIKALLEREPGVKSVRRPAPINQGDKGRDLIIEWSIINPMALTQNTPPTSTIRVVGQCKASNDTVGKNKVLDIRDTVETHNSSGFFLAVSTQLSAPLTEKLEELSLRGIWTQWWNREDIEARISKNDDLIPYFPKVLKSKGKTKFVDTID